MSSSSGMSVRARWIVVAAGLALAGAGLGMVGAGAADSGAAAFCVQVQGCEGESEGAYMRALQFEAAAMVADRVVRRAAEDPASRQAARGWAAEFTDASGAFAADRAADDLAKRVRAVADPASGTIRVEVRGPSPADAASLAGAVQRAALDEGAARARRAGEVREHARRERLVDLDRELATLQTQRETLLMQSNLSPEIASALGEDLRRLGGRLDELTQSLDGRPPAESELIAKQIELLRQRRDDLARRLVDLARTASNLDILRAKQEGLLQTRRALGAELRIADARGDEAGRLVLVSDAGLVK